MQCAVVDHLAARRSAGATWARWSRRAPTRALTLKLNPAQCAVVDHLADTPERERYVDALVKARAKKGLKPEAARELLEDGNYYGTLMTLCAAPPHPLFRRLTRMFCAAAVCRNNNATRS